MKDYSRTCFESGLYTKELSSAHLYTRKGNAESLLQLGESIEEVIVTISKRKEKLT
jgi:hypothetical protein